MPWDLSLRRVRGELRSSRRRRSSPRLPSEMEKIGVFVNETPAQVAEIAEQVGLTGVQLHGDEPADQMRQYRQAVGQRKIIKTLQARELLTCAGQSAMTICNRARASTPSCWMRARRASEAGPGSPFDWEAALPIVAQDSSANAADHRGRLESARTSARRFACFVPGEWMWSRAWSAKPARRMKPSCASFVGGGAPSTSEHCGKEGPWKRRPATLQTSTADAGARQAAQAAGACAPSPDASAPMAGATSPRP